MPGAQGRRVKTAKSVSKMPEKAEGIPLQTSKETVIKFHMTTDNQGSHFHVNNVEVSEVKYELLLTALVKHGPDRGISMSNKKWKKLEKQRAKDGVIAYAKFKVMDSEHAQAFWERLQEMDNLDELATETTNIPAKVLAFKVQRLAKALNECFITSAGSMVDNDRLNRFIKLIGHAGNESKPLGSYTSDEDLKAAGDLFSELEAVKRLQAALRY